MTFWKTVGAVIVANLMWAAFVAAVYVTAISFVLHAGVKV